MGDWHHISAAGGVTVPVQEYAASGNGPVFLMLPALGVRARFYHRLAEGLSSGGLPTYLLEQRGHGESPYRARRGVRFGYIDYLETDIPAAIEFVKAKHPGRPFILGGHSLGGHMSSITAGRRDDIEGVIHLACGFPYAGLYSGRQARQVKFLTRIIPVVCFLFGYYPGDKIGFGGREYKRLMMDWRQWATKGGYDFPGVSGVEAEVASFAGKALSIAFEGDDFMNAKSREFSCSRLSGADMTAVTLGEAEQGKYLGHFDWARKPDGAVQTILEWLKDL